MDGSGCSTPRLERFTSWNDLVPTVQAAAWTPWPVLTGAENFTSIGIQSPDGPARSESLYGLSYPDPSAPV